MKNLKLCFFFLLSPSLFLLFSLFFLFPPSQSSFTTSSKVSRVYPADTWTPEEKQQTLSALSKYKNKSRINWLWVVAFGLKKLEFKSGGKDVVFYFDKLAAAFQEQIFQQKHFSTFRRFDYTKIQGEAQKQLLQPYKRGTTDHVDGFISAHAADWVKYGNFFLNFIRPSLLKMQALGLSQVKVSYDSQYSIEFIITKKNLENLTYEDRLGIFEFFAIDTFSPNFAKTVLDSAINKAWTPWLHTLQKVYSLGLPNITHITVGHKKIDVSSFVFSKVQEASDLSLEQLKTLKKLKILTDIKRILAFQKNWDGGKVSSYLLWLPAFDIVKVELSQNQVVSVDALANAIQSMLTKEKFDFTKLSGEARKQLFDLLNNKGKLREVEIFQDDVWKQIKNHQKWKETEGPAGELSLQLIKTLLLEIQDLGINKVAHPFFPEGYDLSFLKDDKSWKKISFKDLLQGMKVVVNGTYVEFYSHLFPNKIVFQVPMKKLSTVFSGITITNIITALKKTISDHFQQEKKLETKDKGLIIGFSVAGSFLVFAIFGGFLYWFFKVKK